jgi:hypothetical protein
MTSIKDKDLDDVLNNLFGQERSTNNNNGWKEIDLDRRLGGMIPQTPTRPLTGPGQAPNVPQFNQMMSPTSPATVFLREGHTAYKKLEIESPIPVALETGPLYNVIGKEFEYCGKVKVYLAESMYKPIDLGRADPNKFINLVMVRAPFLGTILVPESAVIKKTQPGAQILKG